MKQTLGTVMIFFSIFLLGGVTFVKVEELNKLGLVKEVTLIIALSAFIGLFLMTGGL